MTNDLAKGYLRLAKCTGDVRDAVIMHKQVRDETENRTACVSGF